MKHLLRHKTTGYYAVIGEDVSSGFRHTPNITVLNRDGAGPLEVERWTSTCMQCGRRITADDRCGCWWRRLPLWAQSLVLGFLPVGKFR